MMGAGQASPIGAYLANARGVDDVKEFPAVTETQHAWTTASRALRDRLDQITAGELDATVASPFPLPISDPSALTC